MGTGPANAKKGKLAERVLARKLREAMPELAAGICRSIQSRRGGKDGADVVGLPGFHIEHKQGKAINIRAAYKQACDDSGGKAFPLAVIQYDRAPERLCVMGLQDFLRVLRAAYGYTPPLRFGVQAELFDEPASEEKSA